MNLYTFEKKSLTSIYYNKDKFVSNYPIWHTIQKYKYIADLVTFEPTYIILYRDGDVFHAIGDSGNKLNAIYEFYDYMMDIKIVANWAAVNVIILDKENVIDNVHINMTYLIEYIKRYYTEYYYFNFYREAIRSPYFTWEHYD